jgi:uncharacterized membrane protein (DUF2068 family)
LAEILLLIVSGNTHDRNQQQQQQQQQSNNDLIRYRPTGLTILAVLFVIAGAFTLLGGITTLETAIAQASGPILTELEVLIIPLGIEILCIASFVVALGLFTVKSWWVWLVAVVLSTIGLIVNVVSLVIPNMFPMVGAVVGIAINAIVLYYLSRRNVRQYFGNKAGARESSSTTTTVGI